MSCRFLLDGSFLRYAGRGVLGGFFMWKLSEGCSWGEADLLRRMVRERPGGLSVPSGRSSWFGLFYMWVLSLYFLLRRAMVWVAMAVEASRAAPAPACSTPVWTSCGVSVGAGAGASVAWMVGCGGVLTRFI